MKKPKIDFKFNSQSKANDFLYLIQVLKSSF